MCLCVLVLECSCHQDCNKTGNCCLPYFHHSNIASDNNGTVEYEKSCDFITTETPPRDLLIYYEKYSMITSVRKADNVREKPVLEGQCGSQNVAPWGSLYPVFSKVNNRLYRNIVCATLDGSLDATHFDVFFICDRYDAHRLDLNDIIENGWISNNGKNKCRLEFKYPGDTKDLQMHKCFNEEITMCQASFTFRTVANTNIISEKIFTCDNAPQASSFVKKMYANVFCHVCESLQCSEHDKFRRSSSTYSILIDVNFISEVNKNDLKKDATPMACSVVNVRIILRCFKREGKYMFICTYCPW